QVLIDYDLSDHREIISQTYDGYHFGNNIIYNPWSVTHYFANPNAGPVPYWMNTSSNLFIKQLIFEQRFLKISEVQDLIDGKLVWKALNENIVMKDLKMFRDAVWSLLLFNGYLTAIDKRPSPNNPRKIEYCLKIPNVEVLNYFHLEMESMMVNTHLSDILPLEKQHAKTLFISYNHKDIAFVKRLKNDLVQANIPLIIDIDSMKFGDDIREFIERSVKESDITLSVISENSLKSPWVMLETLETFLRE
ncbi:Toll-Interleukin receptor domain protein, partial [Candidatus Magnetomorum sp. HK-1]